MGLPVVFVATHPIQYQVPLFRLMSERPDLDLTVLFCNVPDKKQQGEGFGVGFEWNIPMLEGYRYEILDNVSKTPTSASFRGCNTPKVREVLERIGPRAVIVNGWNVLSLVQTVRACRRLRIPCIVRGESNLLPRRKLLRRLAHRALLRQYSAYLYIGSRNRDFYRSYGVPDRRLFRCPYCVENGRFEAAASQADGTEFRKAHGIPTSAVCYLFAGKLIPKKKPVELLTAFRDSVERGSSAHLILVGDGALRPECEAVVSAIRDRVHFAGFVNQKEIPEVYAASDCLVLPSNCGETWGLVVNEAMASGRPAIVSDEVGCSPDLIVPRVTGMEYPCNDLAALADLLLHYSTRQDELRAMGENARRHISGYSPENAVAGMVEAIKSVALAN